jgi:hypothetical protein
VAVVVALQHAMDEREGLVEGDVVGVHGERLGLAAKIPEEPLFRDALGHPRHDPVLHPVHPGLLRRILGRLVAVLPLLGSAQHHTEAVLESRE